MRVLTAQSSRLHLQLQLMALLTGSAILDIKPLLSVLGLDSKMPNGLGSDISIYSRLGELHHADGLRHA